MKSEHELSETSPIVIVFALALLPLFAIYHGFVLSTLWRWFAVPLFGLPVVNTLQMVGLLMIASMMHLRLKGEGAKPTLRDAACYVVSPLIALGIGWLFSFSV
jgi:hypothetical protein